MPCYNIERKITRMLESLLNQTYRNLELIFVDDGSTDGTAALIKLYKPKFEEMGMRVIYVYQQNKGLGGCVNRGLREIHGEFLTWPDPDDWLADNSIERKLRFLQENPQYAIVTSNAYVYDEKDVTVPIRKVVSPVTEETMRENQFIPMLRYRSVFCSGCHMVRMAQFRDANPECDIYESRTGHNFQMLLPIYYRYKRAFIDEPLYNYVIYSDSNSHGKDTVEKQLRWADGCLEILMDTLRRIEMPSEEREKYIRIVEIDDAKKRLDLIFCAEPLTPVIISGAEKAYSVLHKYCDLNFKYRLKYVSVKNPALRRVLKALLNRRKA